MYRQQQQMRTLTTPQRLDVMISNMDEMRQMMLERAQATKAFYATLTPDQQSAFDALSASGAGGGGGPGA
jgi:Spy/CpxP family protein refolding chaperone